METKEKFALLGKFFRHHEVKAVDSEFRFEFIVIDEVLKSIAELIEIGVVFNRFYLDQAYVFEELEDLSGKNIEASISREKLTHIGLLVYVDWHDFLSVRKYRLEPPSSFMILKDGDVFPYDSEKASRLKNYLKIIKFIDVLEKVSELESLNASHNKMQIAFIHKSRVDIVISYTAEELDSELGGIELLSGIFSSTEHEAQRNSILKETLYSFLFAQKKEDRFKYLLSRMPEFSTEFMENYNLFVSEFSLESVRKDYEENKRDYIVKINDVISGVHTRMLGVPAILVLAAFRFSDDVKTGQVFGNLLIFVAVLIYIVMMHYLIRSQKDTLSAISDEAGQHIESFRRKSLPEEIQRIGEISQDLKNKCDLESQRLNIFYWMIGMLLLVVLGLVGYSAYTEYWPALDPSAESFNLPEVRALFPRVYVA